MENFLKKEFGFDSRTECVTSTVYICTGQVVSGDTMILTIIVR